MSGLMYKKQTDLPLQVGIYSFKNRKSGYLMFGLKQDKNLVELINDELLDVFKKELVGLLAEILDPEKVFEEDRKSTRLNSSHVRISYAVFCLKKKKKKTKINRRK